MKVALCLSGQFRSIEKCYLSIYNNLILPNSADVFYHSWYSEKQINQQLTNESYKGSLLKDIDKITYKLYNPKKFLVEEQVDFNQECKNINTYPYGIPAFHQFSMFYSIFMANKLKIEYESEKNFIYDCVIRCRFDLRPNNIIKIDLLDLNNLNIKGDCLHNDYCINDHFAISNSHNMNIYSETYKYIKKYYFENKQHFCPEILLGYGLTHDKERILTIKKHNWDYEIIR